MIPDLNCDLGEGERNTALLLDCVTSANIACGGHAGDLATMCRTVSLAVERGVHVGAHPGLADRSGFGRNEADLGVESFELLLLHQIGAFQTILRTAGAHRRRRIPLHHVKLHGALYHAVEASRSLCLAYLRLVAELWPKAIIFGRAGGSVVKEARRIGLTVWPEGFLDRAYRSNGTLVPRTAPNALLDRSQFRQRLRCLTKRQAFASADRTPLNISARTWGLHSDFPDALRNARLARAQLLG